MPYFEIKEVSVRGLKELTEKGILEAKECQFIDAIFDDGARIIRFN